MKLFFDLLAPPALLGSAWLGARHWPSEESPADLGLFLLSFVAGSAAGFRLAWSAFRWGRRRRGKDPERRPADPDEVVLPMLRFLGCSLGALVCSGVGFAFWALAVAFFRSIGP